ncbi:hypothetical protein LXL04_010145 [Taraxacum kok-saghyz]
MEDFNSHETDRWCSVADRWDGNRWVWQWQRRLEGGRTGTELQALGELVDNVSCSLSQYSWVWGISSDGLFSVAETRRWIDDLVLPVGQLKTRWSVMVPHKVNIFIWRLLLDQLPTRARLSGRGFEIESIMCLVCGRAPEHLMHLFCGCEVARNIWGGVFCWLALAPFGDLHPKEVFTAMETCRLSLNQKKVLEVVMYAVWWLIWRYLNDVVHDNRKMRKWLILDAIKEFSFVYVVS